MDLLLLVVAPLTAVLVRDPGSCCICAKVTVRNTAWIPKSPTYVMRLVHLLGR